MYKEDSLVWLDGLEVATFIPDEVSLEKFAKMIRSEILYPAPA